VKGGVDVRGAGGDEQDGADPLPGADEDDGQPTQQRPYRGTRAGGRNLPSRMRHSAAYTPGVLGPPLVTSSQGSQPAFVHLPQPSMPFVGAAAP